MLTKHQNQPLQHDESVGEILTRVHTRNFRDIARNFGWPVSMGVLGVTVLFCLFHVARLIGREDVQQLQEQRQQASAISRIYEIVDGNATPLMQEDIAIYIASTTW